jgi:hypothetical protein
LTFTPLSTAPGSAIVTVQLHDNGGVANSGADTSASQTFTITVNARPSLSIADKSIVEGNSGQTPMPFTVTMSAASSVPVTVNYVSGNGTARSGNDYVATSGTLTFAAGEVTKTVTVQVVGETTKEKDETLGVNLSAATKATIARASAIGIILDDDNTPRVSATTTSTKEGTSSSSSPTTETTSMTMATSDSSQLLAGSTDALDAAAPTGDGALVFVVTLSNASEIPISIDYQTLGLTAAAGLDFSDLTGTLTFGEDETVKYITVPVIGDRLHELNERVILHLSNPVELILENPDAAGDIVDDDAAPTVSVTDVSVLEKDSGSNAAVFTVVLSEPAGKTELVSFATADGSAVAGVDYLAVSGTLTFNPGVQVMTVTVPVAGDTVVEANETFVLAIARGSDATIAKAQGTATIANDDALLWTTSTTTEFKQGTAGTGLYLAEMDGGEITLAPTVGSEFAGTALPTGWTSAKLATGGTSVVGGDVIKVDGAAVLGPGPYAAGRSIEFEAVFSGINQNIGFAATTALTAPYAVFGVKADGLLYARSVPAAGALQTAIPGLWLGAPHRFRIDWNASSVVYSIDGIPVMSHAVTFKTATMRPAIIDQTVSGGSVGVNWIRMSPYAATGTYTSKLFDAGAPGTWQTIAAATEVPAGTAIVLEVRTGDSNATMTPWTAVAPGGVMGAKARYIQYRALLSTTLPGSTPVLKAVGVTYVP